MDGFWDVVQPILICLTRDKMAFLLGVGIFWLVTLLLTPGMSAGYIMPLPILLIVGVIALATVTNHQWTFVDNLFSEQCCLKGGR